MIIFMDCRKSRLGTLCIVRINKKQTLGRHEMNQNLIFWNSFQREFRGVRDKTQKLSIFVEIYNQTQAISCRLKA